VEQIRENPYLQYFLELGEYQERAPFEASMVVHVRKRLSLDVLAALNEAVVQVGAKLTASCVSGCICLDHLSWENFNESTRLQQQAEQFRTRFGHDPASIHADPIDRTRDNRRWCKQRGIRLRGPLLGRPTQEEHFQASLKQQARADEAVRVAIEGKFGQAKRRFRLGGMSRQQVSLCLCHA
jgi:hypothetical protein